MIAHSDEDMASRIAGCGLLSRRMAVCGSGVSTFATGENIGLKGWFFLIVSIEKATSSEVTGLPSWNFAFLRRLSVTLRPSAETFQLSAR